MFLSMTDNTSFTVFFSWQSDVPENSDFLRSFIKSSIKKFETTQNVNVLYDEASRSVVGSQKVEEVILEKIRACDVFIADITPITRIETEEGEKNRIKLLPNPNVAFELGYAMHCLPMEQVLIVLPTGISHGQLPFDFNHNRLIEFDEQTNPMDEEIEKSLAFCMKTRISQVDVIVANPEDKILRPQYKQTKFIAERHKHNDIDSPFASIKQFQESMNQVVTPFRHVNIAKAQVIRKEINHSYSPIHLVIQNNNDGAIDNIDFEVFCNQKGVSIVENNVKDQFSFVQSLGGNSLYVVEETNTAIQHVDTMNPQTIFLLDPFYLKVPYECENISLEWRVSSRQGSFCGKIEMQVKAEVKDVDFVYDDAKIGNDYLSDYIEYVN